MRSSSSIFLCTSYRSFIDDVILTRLFARPETYNDPDKDPFTGLPLDKGESGNELPGNSKESDGFFEKAILGSLESDHTGKGSALEVKAIGNGHW